MEMLRELGDNNHRCNPRECTRSPVGRKAFHFVGAVGVMEVADCSTRRKMVECVWRVDRAGIYNEQRRGSHSITTSAISLKF